MSIWKIAVSTAAVTIAWGLLAGEAEARKEYNNVFWMHYAEPLAAHKAVKCVACHEGESKKMRNDYGKIVKEKLGATEVKDADKIRKALDEAAKEPSAVKGKTFGELIKEGKLPASKP